MCRECGGFEGAVVDLDFIGGAKVGSQDIVRGRGIENRQPWVRSASGTVIDRNLRDRVQGSEQTVPSGDGSIKSGEQEVLFLGPRNSKLLSRWISTDEDKHGRRVSYPMSDPLRRTRHGALSTGLAVVTFVGRFCSVVIVLLVVDLLAVLVLFPVDLLPLLTVECAAICGAFVVDLLGDIRLIAVGAGRFAGGHLAAAQTLGGALLLIGFTIVDLVWPDGIAVVFLVVDLTACGVLLAIDLLTLLAGEMAAVGNAIVVNLLVDVGLRAVGAGCFARGHLATAQAVGCPLG